MKQPIEWLNELAEATTLAMFSGSNPPGNEVERIIEQIQLDAQKELEAWKKQALAVMPDFQAISKALELPLGVDISSNILPGIQKLKAEIAAHKEQLARAPIERHFQGEGQ